MTETKISKPTFRATSGVEVYGFRGASTLSKLMVGASIFFAVEPMPNDLWMFFVKDEAVDQLVELAELAVAMVANNENCETCEADTEGNEPKNCRIYKAQAYCKFL